MDNAMSQVTERKLGALGIGLRWGIKGAQQPYNVYVRRVGDADYRVVAAYRLPEIRDEDPDSVVCGCGYQGLSHAHGEQRVATATEAAALYASTKEALTRRQGIDWARRIGA